MELAYKTRGQVSPEGKPKVYFSSIKEDQDKYFHDLCTKILEFHNCSIWYKPDPQMLFSSKDDAELILGQMQLFVFPVTKSLLTTENPSITEDLPLAVMKRSVKCFF